MADRLVCVISWSDRSVRASSGKRGILFTLNFFYINSALNYPLFYVYCVNIHTGLQHRAGPTTSQRLASARVSPQTTLELPPSTDTKTHLV